MTSTFASHSGSSIETVTSSSSNQLVFTATTSSLLDKGKDSGDSQSSIQNDITSLPDGIETMKQLPLAGLPIYSTPSSASLSGMLRAKTQSFISQTSINPAPTVLPPPDKFNASPVDSNFDQNQACLVCTDRASGLHYGVLSCEGCKAFFKRSIQSSVAYTCPSGNRCKIDKQRRKCCQACRLQKCLDVGMIKEGVRKNRNPGGRVKYEKPTSGQCQAIGSADSFIGSPTAHSFTQTDGDKAEDNSVQSLSINEDKYIDMDCPKFSSSPASDSDCDENFLKEFIGNGEKYVIDQVHNGKQIIVNDVIKKLLEAEPPMLPACPDPDAEDSGVRTITIICEMVERELVMVIDWAKRIPGYTSLCLNDQVVLLQASWLEVFMIDLAFRSIPYKDKLVYACDMVMGQKQSRAAGLDEVNNHAFHLVAKYRNICMDKQEFACLKAIALINSDSRNLSDARRVEAVQGNIYLALQRYTLMNYPDQPLRFAQLLMTLPELKAVSSRGIEKLFSIKVAGEIPMYNLLLEMLEANELLQ